MLAFDFRRGLHQSLIHREKLNGKLFEKAKRIPCFGGADASLDDIEKLAPIDPVQDGAATSFFLVVESFLNNLPTGFAVVQTNQGEAIENELFAHGAPLPGVPGEGRWLKKNSLSENLWPFEWDREEPA